MLIPMSGTLAEACAENGIDLPGQRLSFSVDEETGTTVINIIDNETDEVIRQIPPDEILHLKKRMGEIQGLLLDRKV
jgi:flagellar protein FlaG